MKDDNSNHVFEEEPLKKGQASTDFIKEHDLLEALEKNDFFR